jgi:hypothetical protein
MRKTTEFEMEIDNVVILDLVVLEGVLTVLWLVVLSILGGRGLILQRQSFKMNASCVLYHWAYQVGSINN